MARILDAAGALFIEKGVDGATMTEIASRSGTAIGSLYRFFPTKESLSLTLLERFIHDRLAQLDEICAEAKSGESEAVADLLLGVWLARREERDYTTLLLAARPDAEQSGQAWREQFLARVVAVLQKTCPQARETAAARGMVLLHVLKLAPQLVKGEGQEAVEAEIRKLVLSLVRAS
ncbi:helix-turn-helix domain-containing protein [Asaia sp. BMEF1]|uniref:TetR/AcrR family transcriptional regulator n=1 Tax=Asaia sp. BMEF1 TaxID=3155932 RepID=UPI003F668771